MARGPDRATLEVDTRHDPSSGKWCFVIIGPKRKIMYRSEPDHETDFEARAAARDWMTQTLLR
jgi:hypothetical protein